MQRLIRVLNILKEHGYMPHYGVEPASIEKGQKKYSTEVSLEKGKTLFTFNAYAHGWDDPFVTAIGNEKLGVATDGFGPAKRMVPVEVKNSDLNAELAHLVQQLKAGKNVEGAVHSYLATLVR